MSGWPSATQKGDYLMTYYNDLMNKANTVADGIVTFTNSSWHNDACGSIMFEISNDDETYVQLFAFETDEDMKAEGFEDRFSVISMSKAISMRFTVF